MGLRYALRELRRHGTDRAWWRKRFLTHVVSRYYRLAAGRAGDPVAEEDWDNLLILDACRYDLFAEAIEDHPLPGELSKRRSAGSVTPEFLRKNFGDGTFHDVVYVSANPYVSMVLDPGQFHAVRPVWQDGWSEDLQTVPPETMGERALAAAREFPDKRLVVHFMQPHFPFVGEKRLADSGRFALRDRALGRDAVRETPTPFDRLAAGELAREEVWAAYRSNLEAALPVVSDLLDSLQGRTAVTADHGNALGERAWPIPVRVYGHPKGVYLPALIEVPWLVATNGERKRVVAEPPEPAGETADGAVQERLRRLGYAE